MKVFSQVLLLLVLGSLRSSSAFAPAVLRTNLVQKDQNVINTQEIPFKTFLTTTSSFTALRASPKEPLNVDQTTEKYGLEAGLFQSMKQNDGGQTAKQLLQKYGIAYLATSIPLALVSFAICYALVDAGVDVAALLSKLGLGVSDTNEKVGTFAIAYAAHKAASPIRFPPTVLLTPVVAKWIGKEPNSKLEEGENDDEKK